MRPYWYLFVGGILLISEAACGTSEDRAHSLDDSTVVAGAIDEAKPSTGVEDKILAKFFVVDPTLAPAESLPTELQRLDVCREGGCRVLAQTNLFGHDRRPMKIEVADTDRSTTLSLEMQAATAGVVVQVDVDARWQNQEQHQLLEFHGMVAPGEAAHLGVLHDSSGPGPDVYAVFTVFPAAPAV